MTRWHFLSLWHPVLGWGGPVPRLVSKRTDVTMTLGMTNRILREKGFKWIDAPLETPGDGETQFDALLRDVRRELVDGSDEGVNRAIIKISTWLGD